MSSLAGFSVSQCVLIVALEKETCPLSATSSTKVMTKFPVDAEKEVISSFETFIQHAYKSLRQYFSNIDDINNGSASEAKTLVIERTVDDRTEDDVAIQSISDVLIEKVSKIVTSMWILSKNTHDGHAIKTKVIFGTTSNFDHFIEISIPTPAHGRSVARYSSNVADLIVQYLAPSSFMNPMNLYVLRNCTRTV